MYHNIRNPLHAYTNECAYLCNTRKMLQLARFEDAALKCAGVRLEHNFRTVNV
jgi:hypothetical protein